MNILFITGVTASILTAVSMLPQLIKMLKEKRVQEISWLTLITLMTGVGLWTVYGILNTDWIIIVSNGFSFLLNGLILSLNFYYRKNAG